MPSDCNFLDCCSNHSWGVPQSPDCGSSYNMQVKMSEDEVDDDKDIVNDVEGVQNLGGREMLSCMREGISVCVVGWC